MDFRKRIIVALADAECARVCRTVIRGLQRMRGAMMSGDDSGLANTWDEICVQVQSQDSIFCEAYEDTMRAFLREQIEKLPAHVRQAIWLQTYEGDDWATENEGEEQCTHCIEDIEEHVFANYLLAEAATWSNPRIREYLQHDFEMLV